MLYFGFGIGGLIFVIGLATYFLAPRVGPNPFFGVRVGYAFASRAVWDKTNRAGGIVFAAVGLGLMLGALILQLLNIAPRDAMATLSGAMVIALVGATVWLVVYARQLARDTAPMRELAPVKFRWAFLAPVLITFALLIAVMLYFYPTLPAQKMATHFNIAEQPDGWMTRDAFVVSYLGIAALIAAINLVVVIVATREPLIAFGRWGACWRLDPARGLIFAGCTFALTNLILIVALGDVAWFNTRDAHLFPLSLLLWMIIPLIAILVALYFWLGRRDDSPT
jgi:uncharacterized membrane protein